MRYDPIMCMMVDDSVKTKDAKSYGKYKLPNGEIVEVIDRKNVHGADTIVYKNSRGVHFATVDWFMSNAKKVRDSVKAKDANKNEGFKIHKAEIRGDKLYLTYTDLLYGGKETESFTKSEAKGFLTDPWNTWEGNTKSIMMKFVKDSNTIDKAIRSCDEQIRLVKTISKKNGYAIHIVEGGYGERIVLTFPNESYANPHMWLGSNNSSNIQKAKELLDEFSK